MVRKTFRGCTAQRDCLDAQVVHAAEQLRYLSCMLWTAVLTDFVLAEHESVVLAGGVSYCGQSGCFAGASRV